MRHEQLQEFLKIAGNCERYSLENFLFDPVLIGVLLLRRKIIKSADAGLGREDTHLTVGSFSVDKLQVLADYVCKQVRANISTKDTGGNVAAKYMNNQTIFIPHWYVNYNGHDLEETLKRTFHKLREFKKEAAMKMAIIEEVLDDHPGLIAVDFYNLFKDIQEA